MGSGASLKITEIEIGTSDLNSNGILFSSLENHRNLVLCLENSETDQYRQRFRRNIGSALCPATCYGLRVYLHTERLEQVQSIRK